MGHYHDMSRQLQAEAKVLRELIPDAWSGFVSMHRGAMAGGALDAKTKELIALAISTIDECDGCVSSHARGAARRGATDQEVAEALGVALLMGGGPATVWAPRAFAAFREYQAD